MKRIKQLILKHLHPSKQRMQQAVKEIGIIEEWNDATPPSLKENIHPAPTDTEQRP